MEASQEASSKSWGMIRNAFARAVPDGSGYTLCYGYWIKSGFFSKTMYNYAIGFRADTKEIVLVPIDSDGKSAGETLRLQKSDVTSVKKTFQGEWKIASSLTDKPLVLAVGYYLPDAVEDSYQLPINQHKEAEQFHAMMKSY